MRARNVLGAGVVGVLALAGAARADFRVEKSFDLPAGGSFHLHSEAGGVEVRGTDGNKATIVVTSTREDFADIYDLTFEPTGADRLDVRIERKPGLHWPSGWNARTRVEVTLPKTVLADIESSGGGVDASGLAARLRVSSSGGGVHVDDVQADVDLRSSGGGITANNVGGNIDASSSGGGVRIDEAHGEVLAESSGGSVKVTFAAGNAKGGDLSSSGGGVQARVDPAVGLELDAHSSGGGLTCDLPVTVRGKIGRDSIRGQLNGGGARLKVRSSGGGVTIESR